MHILWDVKQAANHEIAPGNWVFGMLLDTSVCSSKTKETRPTGVYKLKSCGSKGIKPQQLVASSDYQDEDEMKAQLIEESRRTNQKSIEGDVKQRKVRRLDKSCQWLGAPQTKQKRNCFFDDELDEALSILEKADQNAGE